MPYNVRNEPQLFALEHRMMFDGATVATTTDILEPELGLQNSNDDNKSSSSLNANSITEALNTIDLLESSGAINKKEIIFIDNSIAEIEKIKEGLPKSSTIFVLNESTNGIKQISDILEKHKNLSAIHILSHGNMGSITIGSNILDDGNLSSHRIELEKWGDSLSENGDILFYACSIGADEIGKQFIEKIASITDADVGASDNLTGDSFFGGDWMLEYHSGSVDVAPIEIQSYEHVLASPGAHWGVSGTGGNTEVFLGGNYIELGINKAGNYGTTTAASAASVTGSSFTGANVSASSLYSNHIGLSHDIDGFGEGTSESFDYFLPGTPYAQWRVGFDANSGSEEGNDQSGAGVTSVTENIPTTVSNESSGTNLQARIESSYTTGGKTLGISQIVSFDVDDMYYTTTVTLTNNSGGAASMSDVRYMWGVDPDQSVDVGGSYNTTNTVTQTHSAGDGVARVLSSRLVSDGLPVANLFIESDNNVARVSNDIIRTDVYDTSNYELAPSKDSTNNNDTGVGITFSLGTLADGASTTFSFITRLTNQSLAEIVAETRTSEGNNSNANVFITAQENKIPELDLTGLTQATGGRSITAENMSMLNTQGARNINDITDPKSIIFQEHRSLGADGLNTKAAIKGLLGPLSLIERTDTPIMQSVTDTYSQINNQNQQKQLLENNNGENKPHTPKLSNDENKTILRSEKTADRLGNLLSPDGSANNSIVTAIYQKYKSSALSAPEGHEDFEKNNHLAASEFTFGLSDQIANVQNLGKTNVNITTNALKYITLPQSKSE